jgi:DNA repair exonuclease SbcCD ATPase subunit
MILLKNLTLRNFLSIGQVTQAINFDRSDLTLILGENLDLGGDGARNGTGKTSLLQGVSYGLFGVAINNIKKDNLINRTNAKGMLVTVEFSIRGMEYKIVRGRKPNILKFYINNQEQQVTDDSQGDSRETQTAIERVLCMSSDMFKQIVALNTYNEPFLGMKVSDQRMIIEQLLGITLLSEKADAIRELNKQTKDSIQQEEYRVKGKEEANKRIQEQIESLKKRQRLWNAKHDADLTKLVNEYDDLAKIDITAELKAHADLAAYNVTREQAAQYNALLARQTAWREKLNREVAELEESYDKLSLINIDQELQAHKNLALYLQAIKDKSEHDEKLNRVRLDIKRESKNWSKLDTEIQTLKEHKCYACGQEFHDDSHATVLDNKITLLTESRNALDTYHSDLAVLEANPIVVGTRPVTHYKTETEAIKHSSEIEKLLNQIANKNGEVDPYADQLADKYCVLVGAAPVTHYDTESEAIKHSGRVINLLEQIEKKHEDSDPYVEQIDEMSSTGIQSISFDEINRLTRVLQHQDYLLDLLTNKKSFVRKRIIDQNLAYLNARLTHYLDKMGLPHQVVFQNDLSVEITELGREMDFYNLSRGEMNRVILSLSWAFRDVWESLYSPINILFIDELLDNGTDAVGMENSLVVLKDMCRRRNKAVWLVSHKEELFNRVDNILKVVKENGFSSYETTTEMNN